MVHSFKEQNFSKICVIPASKEALIHIRGCI